MQRRRVLRWALSFLAAGVGLSFGTQLAFADSLTLSPMHGQPTDPVTATYVYVDPTGAPCPVGQLAIDFWWDTQNYPIQSVLLTVDANKDCVAILKFVPANVKGAPVKAGQHIVIGGPKGTIGARAPYTIDPPPPPPSPSPSPTPTPTHPPTNPPPNPPTNPPTNRPKPPRAARSSASRRRPTAAVTGGSRMMAGPSRSAAPAD